MNQISLVKIEHFYGVTTILAFWNFDVTEVPALRNIYVEIYMEFIFHPPGYCMKVILSGFLLTDEDADLKNCQVRSRAGIWPSAVWLQGLLLVTMDIASQ